MRKLILFALAGWMWRKFAAPKSSPLPATPYRRR